MAHLSEIASKMIQGLVWGVDVTGRSDEGVRAKEKG